MNTRFKQLSVIFVRIKLPQFFVLPFRIFFVLYVLYYSLKIFLIFVSVHLNFYLCVYPSFLWLPNSIQWTSIIVFQYYLICWNKVSAFSSAERRFGKPKTLLCQKYEKLEFDFSKNKCPDSCLRVISSSSHWYRYVLYLCMIRNDIKVFKNGFYLKKHEDANVLYANWLTRYEKIYCHPNKKPATAVVD